MAVYFDPGWGEQLKNALSGIGTGIRDIINPNFEAQKKLQAALADPKIAQEYANMASVNPQLLSNPAIGGKNADFIRQLKPSQQFKNEQAIQGEVGTQLQNPGVRSDAARRQLKLNTANEDRIQNQQIDINDMKIQDIVKTNEFLAANPDLERRRQYMQSIGMQPEQVTEIERRAKLVEEGMAMNPAEGMKLLQDSLSNGFQDYQKLEAFAAANPNAYRLMVDQLDFDRRSQFELEMFRRRASVDRGLSNEQRIFQARLSNAQSLAGKYRVDVGTMIAKLGYDKLDPTFASMTEGVTPMDLQDVNTKVNSYDAAQSNALERDRISMATRVTSEINQIVRQAGDDKKNRAIYAAQVTELLNRYNSETFQSFEAKFDGNELKVYDYNPDTGKSEEVPLVTLINRARYSGGRTPLTTTAPITATPPGSNSVPPAKSGQSSTTSSAQANELDQKPGESDADYRARLRAMRNN